MDDLLQEMIQPAGPTGHDRARRRRLVMSAATVGLAVIGVTSLTTSALFTDNDAASSNLFTTGTVDIANSPATTILSAGNMAPGDTVWGPVTVQNNGSLGLRYAVAYLFTDNDTTPRTDANPGVASSLSTQLSLKVVTGAESCPAAGPVGGTEVASIAAGSAAIGNITDTAPTEIVGDLVTTEGGGVERALDSQVSEVLCVGVGMSIDADNRYQETSANLTLKFLAEQTANNPLPAS